MRVVVTESVGDAEAGRLWAIFDDAFMSARELSVSREHMDRVQFLALVGDPRIVKYVLEDDAGTVVGASLLTRDLDAVPWVSADFFAKRWPQECAEGRVFYSLYSFVDPQRQGADHFRLLIEPVVAAVARARGVLGFDLTGHHADVVDLMAVMARRVPGGTVSDVTTLDTQLYYAVTFGSGTEETTLDGRAINLDAEVAGSGRPKR